MWKFFHNRVPRPLVTLTLTTSIELPLKSNTPSQIAIDVCIAHLHSLCRWHTKQTPSSAAVDWSNCLSKRICSLPVCFNPLKPYFLSLRNQLTYKVVSHADVFCIAVVNRVCGQLHGCLVVNIDKNWWVSVCIAQFFEHGAEKQGLLACLRSGDIFWLTRGGGDDFLKLWLPDNWPIEKLEDVCPVERDVETSSQ